MSAVDKKRIKAENVMRDLEKLGPRLAEAYEAYLSLSVEYYDLWERLQYYRKHGVVSDDEVSSYPRRPGMDQTEKPFGQRLKEHRRKKKLLQSERIWRTEG